MFRKCLYILIKINSYIPLVFLPVYTYTRFNNIMLAGITIVLWRFLTYYKYKIVGRVLKYTAFKVIFTLIILVGLFYPGSLDYEVISIVLLSSLLSNYMILENISLKISRIAGLSLIIAGMIIAGASLYYTSFLFYYFFIFNIVLLWTGKCSPIKNKTVNTTKIIIYDAVNVFFHNFYYYLIAFSIPIIAYNHTGEYCMSGIACSTSWILFLLKDNFINFLKRYLNIRLILALGFTVTSLFLVIIGMTNDIIIIFLCLLLQGASAGIAEGFWELKTIKKNPACYWDIWKAGGISGGVIGSLLIVFRSISLLFFAGAVLSLIGGIINFYLGINANKNAGGVSSGY